VSRGEIAINRDCPSCPDIIPFRVIDYSLLTRIEAHAYSVSLNVGLQKCSVYKIYLFCTVKVNLYFYLNTTHEGVAYISCNFNSFHNTYKISCLKKESPNSSAFVWSLIRSEKRRCVTSQQLIVRGSLETEILRCVSFLNSLNEASIMLCSRGCRISV